MLEGSINCACPQPSALASDGGTPAKLILVQGQEPALDNAVWQIGLRLNKSGTPLGTFLTNKASGCSLRAVNGALYFAPVSWWDGSSTWTFGGQFYSRWTAVRVFNDDNQNLNVLGGCGGSIIGVAGWGGGQRNEIWEFLAAANPPAFPSKFRVVSRCGSSYYLYVSQGQVLCGPWAVQGAADAEDASIWTIEPAVTGDGWLMGGMSIVNVSTGKAIRAAGYDNPVTLIDPSKQDDYAVWNFGIGDGTNPFVAVRPIADINQNLNIRGGCNGATVITAGWGHGDPNETWQLVPLTGRAIQEKRSPRRPHFRNPARPSLV
jgi:hypothetical protein